MQTLADQRIQSRQGRLPEKLRAVWPFVLVKAVYWLSLWLIVASRLVDFTGHYRAALHWPRESAPTRWSYFASWDVAHYLYLSEVGYKQGDSSCAFYPLWPLLVRWVAPLAGGNHLIAGLLLGNLCSVAAWILFFKLVQARWGSSVAVWALVFLILFPGSLFFSIPVY